MPSDVVYLSVLKQVDQMLDKILALGPEFWSLAKPTPTGCWEWQGPRNTEGYGTIKHYRAHRVSWMLANAELIPEEMHVRHSCDNPPCVNPLHLSLGTHQDNMNDRRDRGRAHLHHYKKSRPTRTNSDHCRNGHLWAENTRYDTYGRRVCSACRTNATKKWMKNREARRRGQS